MSKRLAGLIAAAAFLAANALAQVQKLPQTVSFTEPIPEETVPDRYILVGAQATSGLPVVFTVSGGCELLSGTLLVYVHSLGTCTIAALQEGNDAYEAASATANVRVVWALRLTTQPSQPVGALLTVSFAYGDEAPARAVVCAIDWDDPAAPGAELGTFSVFFWNKTCRYSHAYSAPGIYRIHPALYDPMFGYAVGTAEVLIFDPSAVAVRAQGGYHSRRGSFMLNPELSGDVIFNIDARIEGIGVPGVAWFALEGTDVWFRADRIYSINPGAARYVMQGEGVDHEGRLMSFEAVLTDTRGSGIDRIRLVLRDARGVVYDSEGAGASAALPTTELRWGDIALFYQ